MLTSARMEFRGFRLKICKDFISLQQKEEQDKAELLSAQQWLTGAATIPWFSLQGDLGICVSSVLSTQSMCVIWTHTEIKTTGRAKTQSQILSIQ